MEAERRQTGWVMPVIELERAMDMHQDMVTTQQDYFISDKEFSLHIPSSDLWSVHFSSCNDAY